VTTVTPVVTPAPISGGRDTCGPTTADAMTSLEERHTRIHKPADQSCDRPGHLRHPEAFELRRDPRQTLPHVKETPVRVMSGVTRGCPTGPEWLSTYRRGPT
jgi:hypothetical protein